MRDKIIYFAYKAKFLMESSIDGLCLFVQTSLLFVDSPIFANLLFLCCLNSWMCFNSSCLSYIDMSLCVCDKEVVNLVSIYHSCESISVPNFLLWLFISFIFVSVCPNLFSWYTFYKVHTIKYHLKNLWFFIVSNIYKTIYYKTNSSI